MKLESDNTFEFPGPQLLDGLDVQFTGAALADVIAAAGEGVCLYSLFSIRCVADVQRFVHVRITASKEAMAFIHRRDSSMKYWIDERLPVDYADFLKLTRDLKTSLNWHLFIRDSGFEEFMHYLFNTALTVQREMRANDDPFICYEIKLIDSCRHPDDSALIEAGLCYARRPYAPDIRRCYNEDLYRAFAILLAHPNIESLAYRGSADFQALKLACLERARRGGLPHTERDTFPINILDERNRWNIENTSEPDDEFRTGLQNMPAWFHGIRYYSEGLGDGDLFLDDGTSGRSLAWLIDNRGREPPKAALLILPEAELHPLFRWWRHGSGFRVGARKDVEFGPSLNQDLIEELGLVEQRLTD